MIVFGTRPEAIKMVPVINELKKENKNFQLVVVVTGQHKEILDSILDQFNIKADYNYGLMTANQSLSTLTARVLLNLDTTLSLEKPDIVLVHGDTTTAYAAGLAAFYHKISVGHIEAGLRTNRLDSPFPEELNRQMLGKLSDFHFAPTKHAKENLLKERVVPGKIYVTGNTVIDTLKLTVGLNNKKKVKRVENILLTVHRRENLNDRLEEILKAIKDLVEENSHVTVVFPIHPNPHIRKIAEKILGEENRIKLVDPLETLEFHKVLANSDLVLTDSGGLQEEAPALNIPVLVLRDTTERPEGLETGAVKLIGVKRDEIYQEALNVIKNKSVYDQMSNAKNPYGDGYASNEIVRILKKEIL